MDAETRHTLTATVPSTFVRVSFVFLALREHDREYDASAQKKKEDERKVGKWKTKKLNRCF